MDCVDPDGDSNTVDDVPDVLNCSWRQDPDSGWFQLNTFDDAVKNVQDLGSDCHFLQPETMNRQACCTPGSKALDFLCWCH